MTMMPEIHWSCIARNKVILCEAGEDDTPDRGISKMAQTLMAKKQTPGWEFYRPRRSEYHSIKFHVYDQDLAGDMMVWEFACVYDKALPQDQAQSFLEKLVVLTEGTERVAIRRHACGTRDVRSDLATTDGRNILPWPARHGQ